MSARSFGPTLHRAAVVFLLGPWLAGSGEGQGLASASPESAGFSSVRLERIDRVMQEEIERDRLAGAVALVYRRGKVAYLGRWGMRDREAGLPMTQDTIFRIASMTKPITSLAAMMLFEEGRFLLDDPVVRFLPEFRDLEVLVDEEKLAERRRAGSPITIRDLLRHTAGLTYGSSRDTALNRLYRRERMPKREESLAENVRRLARLPLMHQPGSTWEYSLSVDVLGRLVEVLSGMPLDRFFRERIFRPLGMTDTGFFAPQSRQGRLARLYTVDENLEIKSASAEADGRARTPSAYLSGGAGLVSTVPDYLRFCRMLLGGGSVEGMRLLSPKTVGLMTADHLGEIPVVRADVLVRLDLMRPGYGFGLGFAVAREPARIGVLTSAGEYNWGGAAGTRFWIDPKEDLIGIFMTQVSAHPRFTFASRFQNLVYQAIID